MWLRSQCLGLNDSGNLGLLELCDRASFSSIVLVLEAEIGFLSLRRFDHLDVD
jgi:hypothetical protein